MDTQATGVNADIVERAKSLFSDSLLRLNKIDGPYFYEVSGTNKIPGSLSFLLGVTEVQLLSVYKFCGFYSTTRSCFSEDFFRTFLKAFHVPTELLRYNTKVDLYSIVILGGGDTEWVACAIGKENMAGQHCNHCQR
jgi:hypothetical protein